MPHETSLYFTKKKYPNSIKTEISQKGDPLFKFYQNQNSHLSPHQWADKA
jgi:hypothetical protein